MIEETLIESFEPWMTADLQDYLSVLSGMFAETLLYSDDTDEYEGWTLLLDPDRAPAAALPYLAQYVGEILPVGISEPMAREWIKDAPNQVRGTVQSIVRAAQRSLAGMRHVAIVERDNGSGGVNVDRLTVITYTSETPYPAAVLADLLMVVPADIVLNYETLAGQTWLMLRDSPSRTWATVKSSYPTWAEAQGSLIGLTTWTRPVPL